MGASAARTATLIGIFTISFALGAIAAPAISFAGPCPRVIAGCGCAIVSRGRYTVGSALSQAGAGDCIAIKADGVQLDLAGSSLTGPAAPALLSVGVHVMRRANGVTIVGGGATISQFTNGLMIEGSRATLSGLSANSNENGIVVSGRDAELTNFGASNNASDGVALFGASHARLSDFTASSNLSNGVEVSSRSKNNELSGFAADSNGYAGVLLSRFFCGPLAAGPACNQPGSVSTSVVGGNLDSNGSYGIEISQSHRNQIIGNSASGNGSDDLYDSTLECGSDNWFGNSFTTANRGCID